MASVFKPAGAKKYVITYRDAHGRLRKKTGTRDKAVSERIGRELENRVALRKEGRGDPKAEGYRDHAAQPLSAHMAEWRESMAAKGSTPKHIDLFATRAARVVALVKGAELVNIEPAKNAKRAAIAEAEANLTKYVSSARLADLTADAVQKALGSLKTAGRSLATCNHHRAAVKAFSAWCYETHRIREDGLRGVAGFNAKEDRRHDRRTVSLDELRRLIESAERGPVHCGVDGRTRALCYRLAVASCLRYSEIASITSEAFD
jgi:integrase